MAKGIAHPSRDALMGVIRELKDRSTEKELKRQLATLRANLATRLYEQSEPIQIAYYNSDGKHIATATFTEEAIADVRGVRGEGAEHQPKG